MVANFNILPDPTFPLRYPEWKRKRVTNYTKRFKELPCEPEPEVLIEAVAGGLFSMFWSIFDFDPKHAYHAITGEPFIHTFRESIKDALPAEAAEHWSTRYAGKLLGAADLAVWWLFLASSAQDGLYDTLHIYSKMQRCPGKRGMGRGIGVYKAA